jgi:hypothetical protein
MLGDTAFRSRNMNAFLTVSYLESLEVLKATGVEVREIEAVRGGRLHYLI